MRLRHIFLLLLPFWLLFVFVTPPFQTPDEDGHYGYVQSLHNGKYPVLPQDYASIPKDRAEELEHLTAQFALPKIAFFQFVMARQESSGNYGKHLPSLPKSSIQANHPPVFYIVASAAHTFADSAGLSMLAKFYLTRMMNGIFYFLFLFFAFKTFRLLFNKTLSFGLLIFTALQPMILFIGAAVNPEMAAVAFSTAAFYYAAKILLTKEISWKSVRWLAIASALAVLSKVTAIIFVPVFVAAYLWMGKEERKEKIRYMLGYLGFGLLLLSPWLIFNLATYQTLFPDNFDILFKPKPETPAFIPLIQTIYYDLTKMYQEIPGAFGWLDAYVFYGTRLTYMYILSIGMLAGLIVAFRQKSKNWQLGRFALLYIVGITLIMIYLSQFFHNHYIERAVLQGRYALIGWIAAAVLIGIAVQAIPRLSSAAKARWLIALSIGYYFFVMFHTLIPRYYV